MIGRFIKKIFNYSIKKIIKHNTFRSIIIKELERNFLSDLLKSLAENHKHDLLEYLAENHRQDLFQFLTEAHKYDLLQYIAATLHQQNLSDGECSALAHAANASLHYSQEGEDIILERILGKQESGFYVDVGAHHPTRFSNTYALYRKGWRGINIEANPGSMEAFQKFKPEDINIETAVSDRLLPMDFYMFKEPALNTFNAALANTYIQSGCEKQEIKTIIPRPLADILDEYITPETKIDFMSIDVEGEEMGVLRSNNWDKYAPRYLALEVLDTPLLEIMNDPAIVFLSERGYVPIAKLVQTVILQKQLKNDI